MGTCFVSGKRKKMKLLMIKIKPANSKKIPYWRWQRDTRKHCAIKAVKIMFTQTTILCPADLVSRGKSSLGTNQPKGPQDLPKAKTNKQRTTTRNMPIPFGSFTPCPNFRARVIPVATCRSSKYIFKFKKSCKLG